MRRKMIVAAAVALALTTGVAGLFTGTENQAEAGYYGYGYGYRRPVARAVGRGVARVVVGAPVRPYPVYRPYGYYGGYGYGPGVGVSVWGW